ncbi:hypothetical protein ACJX0J_014155, partial [Zea mays]
VYIYPIASRNLIRFLNPTSLDQLIERSFISVTQYKLPDYYFPKSKMQHSISFQIITFPKLLTKTSHLPATHYITYYIFSEYYFPQIISKHSITFSCDKSAIELFKGKCLINLNLMHQNIIT